VDVAPHDVFYDDARQLWYCDIEIEAGASYFPFIRLALARYQPTSSPGAHLSNVVLSDIVALAPDRWLNATPAGDDRMRVAVFGAGFDASSGHDEAVRASSSMRVDPVTGLLLLATPASVAAHSVVEVWLERLDARWGEDFGWQRVTEAHVTQRVPAGASVGSGAPLRMDTLLGRTMQTSALLKESVAQSLSSQVLDRIQLWQTLWEGEVRVPAADDTRYRVVVAEYEEYLVDDAQPYDQTPTRKERRVVFVEHFELA
jgi:hypothetical protein